MISSNFNDIFNDEVEWEPLTFWRSIHVSATSKLMDSLCIVQ